MRKRNLLCFIFIVCSITAMRKRPLSPERPAPEEIQESELAAKTQKVVAPQAQKELSEQTKAQIQWLRGLAERGEFSNEIGARILLNLAKVKMRGATQEQKLFNAIANIRAFMEAFPQFYGDEQINKALIQELSKHYSARIERVAIALATTGAGSWLQKITNIRENIRAIGHELIHAAKHGDLGAVRFIITYVPQTINAQGLGGETPLMVAAVNCHLSVIERLLEVPEIDVNKQNISGNSALMLATDREGAGYTAVVQRLLQVPGINVNLPNKDGMTALIRAAANGNLSLVERLLQAQNINVNHQNLAVITAAYNGHTAVVERLLQVPGINVNAQDQGGYTALIFAVQNGHIAVVERLLQVPGINVNFKNKGGYTALMGAAEDGNVAIVELLLQIPGINVNLQNQSGETALMWAAQNGHIQIVQRLLQVPGINVNLQSQRGVTALMGAAQNGHIAVVQLLLQVLGINVNFQTQEGFTALMGAALDGHAAVVDRLVQVQGINVNARSTQGTTALGYARRLNSPNKDAIIKLLIDHGAVE